MLTLFYPRCRFEHIAEVLIASTPAFGQPAAPALLVVHSLGRSRDRGRIGSEEYQGDYGESGDRT